MRNLKAYGLGLSGLVFGACAEKDHHQSLDQMPSQEFVVDLSDPAAEKSLPAGQDFIGFTGPKLSNAYFERGRTLKTSSARAQELLDALASSPLSETEVPLDEPQNSIIDGLIAHIPLSFLGQAFMLGAVVTGVDSTEEGFGDLKLTDIPPVHVRPVLVKQRNKYWLQLRGCLSECVEKSPQVTVYSLPILGISPDGRELTVDLAALANHFSFIEALSRDGGYEEEDIESVQAKTIWADFSKGTLVFDILNDLVFNSGLKLGLTTRWYIKWEAGLNSAFEERTQTKGVGFFTTSRRAKPLINRHSLKNQQGLSRIHYFIKDVPPEHQEAFALAFEGWNDAFQKLGRIRPLTYRFISSAEAAKQIITGDVRFNILEWDLRDQASYGGLGPSVASQNTGEIFSSNVLVQGPTILSLYKEWFGLEDASLDAKDRNLLARELTSKWQAYVRKVGAKRLGLKFHEQIIWAKGLSPEVSEKLEVPTLQFFPTPPGETYESYMKGYFMELVAHELGHNLGLRHNFKGNLGASDSDAKPSISVMEYLGRPYRYKNHIESYDLMALNYGYFGELPTFRNLYCTDEDVPYADAAEGLILNAECSRDDATSDPFSYFLSLVARTLDIVVARGSPEASVWTVSDVETQLEAGLNGLGFYVSSAPYYFQSWQAFGGHVGRPQSVGETYWYVKEQLHQELCNPSIATEIRRKASQTAREESQAQYKELLQKSAELLRVFKLEEAASCDL